MTDNLQSISGLIITGPVLIAIPGTRILFLAGQKDSVAEADE